MYYRGADVEYWGGVGDWIAEILSAGAGEYSEFLFEFV